MTLDTGLELRDQVEEFDLDSISAVSVAPNPPSEQINARRVVKQVWADGLTENDRNWIYLFLLRPARLATVLDNWIRRFILS